MAVVADRIDTVHAVHGAVTDDPAHHGPGALEFVDCGRHRAVWGQKWAETECTTEWALPIVGCVVAVESVAVSASTVPG